jgi:hypothetical protein
MNASQQRPLVLSYTVLAAYKNCGHAMFRRYIARDVPFVASEASDWGNTVHSAFERRVGSHVPLPENMQKWEPLLTGLDERGAVVEQKLGFSRDANPCGFFDNDVWVRVKIDLYLMQGAKAYLLDWKTGNSKYEDPFELEIQALALKLKFPELVEVKGRYVWLKEDRPGQAFDLSRFQATWAEIERLDKMIREDQVKGFSKHKSGLCGWCDVRDCEHNTKKGGS